MEAQHLIHFVKWASTHENAWMFAEIASRQMTPTRIAILDCDPLTEPIRKRYGDYGGVVVAFLRAGAEHVGLPLDDFTLSVWDVVERQDYPALDEVDSILITGSSTYWYQARQAAYHV